jgi:sortase (surface protein transpeptidase)
MHNAIGGNKSMQTSKVIAFYPRSIPRMFGLLCILLALASCSLDALAQETANQTNTNTQPDQVRIPDLKIDAPIIPVGINSYGAMEAPGAGHRASDPIWGTTFWWKEGAQPGQVGNAVLAGHVDRNDGSRAVFWNLDKIHPGNLITIVTQSGQTLTFRVTDVEAFDNPDGGPNDPIIQRVFGPATSANLNLITCYGDWVGTEYNKRLVVFSTLVTGA